jgi:hypothetical protein
MDPDRKARGNFVDTSQKRRKLVQIWSVEVGDGLWQVMVGF